MSWLQILFIGAAGIAGYLLVSFVIDAVRKDRPSLPEGDESSEESKQAGPPAARSAWDEFGDQK